MAGITRSAAMDAPPAPPMSPSKATSPLLDIATMDNYYSTSTIISADGEIEATTTDGMLLSSPTPANIKAEHERKNSDGSPVSVTKLFCGSRENNGGALSQEHLAAQRAQPDALYLSLEDPIETVPLNDIQLVPETTVITVNALPVIHEDKQIVVLPTEESSTLLPSDCQLIEEELKQQEQPQDLDLHLQVIHENTQLVVVDTVQEDNTSAAAETTTTTTSSTTTTTTSVVVEQTHAHGVEEMPVIHEHKQVTSMVPETGIVAEKETRSEAGMGMGNVTDAGASHAAIVHPSASNMADQIIMRDVAAGPASMIMPVSVQEPGPVDQTPPRAAPLVTPKAKKQQPQASNKPYQRKFFSSPTPSGNSVIANGTEQEIQMPASSAPLPPPTPQPHLKSAFTLVGGPKAKSKRNSAHRRFQSLPDASFTHAATTSLGTMNGAEKYQQQHPLQQYQYCNMSLVSQEEVAHLNQELYLAVTKYGQHHFTVAQLQNKLGCAMFAAGAYYEALSCYQEALTILTNVKNRNATGKQLFVSLLKNMSSGAPNASGTVKQRNTLEASLHTNAGATLWRLERNHDALDSFTKAYQVYASDVSPRGKFSIHRGNAAHYLGCAFMRVVDCTEAAHKDHCSDAMDYLHEALTIRIRHHGKKHLEVARTLSLLGTVFAKKDRLQDALKWYRDALKMKQQLLDALSQEEMADTSYSDSASALDFSLHQSILVSMKDVARMYFLLEQFEEALLIYQSARKLEQTHWRAVGMNANDLSSQECTEQGMLLHAIGNVHAKLAQAGQNAHEAHDRQKLWSFHEAAFRYADAGLQKDHACVKALQLSMQQAQSS